MYEPETITATIYGKTEKIKIVTKELNMLKLSQKVKVVVLKTAKGRAIAFISTDLSLTAAQIIEIYSARFSIELSIRDMQQFLGLGDYQHQDLLPVMRHLHLVATAFNIAKIIFLKHSDATWLDNSETGGTPWTSELSLSRLRYSLKRYTLGKLISNKLDNSKEVNNFDVDINTIIDIAN